MFHARDGIMVIGKFLLHMHKDVETLVRRDEEQGRTHILKIQKIINGTCIPIRHKNKTKAFKQ